jgi:hypothetical protein
MQRHGLHRAVVAKIAMAGLASFALAGPSSRAEGRPMEKGEIPKSIRVEHEEIHSTLAEATKAAGAVGVAARELAQVLHPHFVREEQIALPPLGRRRA